MMARLTIRPAIHSASWHLALLLGILVAATGCRPPSQQDVASKYADLVKSVADRLEKVQSREDADQAAADIEKLLAGTDQIVAEARKTDAKEKVASEVKQAVESQLERLKASADRLRNATLMTDSLARAMEQLGLSSQAIAAAASTGKAAPAQSKLEEAWLAVLNTYQEQADLLATIAGPADAERAVSRLVELERKRRTALVQVAKLGGERPPGGVPAKYRKQYDAAQKLVSEKDAAVTGMLGPETAQRLSEQIQQALASDPAIAEDPFLTPCGIRVSATRTTIKLVNNRSLAGERHQQMIARLKQLAGATESQALVGPDGSYQLVLAPVGDYEAFIKSIDFGDVSERNDQEFTFTLTIDPARFVSAVGPGAAEGDPGARFGRPGPGGPSGPGSVEALMQQQKDQFMARVGGKHKCVTIVLLRAPKSGSSKHKELMDAIRRVSGATSTASFSINGERQVLVGPVDDVSALAAAIDFGTVTAKDPSGRRITVAVDITKYSEP